jgi:hypothetical protein
VPGPGAGDPGPCPRSRRGPHAPLASLGFFQDLAAATGSEEGAFEALARESGDRFAGREGLAGPILFLLGPGPRLVIGTVLTADSGYLL